MATAAVTYTFTAGTAAVASQVNQNYTDLVTFLNNSVVHKDGSVAMTGGLTLPASDPTGDNNAVRRAYVQPIQVAKLTSSFDLGSIATDFYIPSAFTMPTVTAPHVLFVDMFFPRVKVLNDFGLGHDQMALDLRKTDNTVLQSCQVRTHVSADYYGDAPVMLRYQFHDNTQIAAGASAALKVRGVTDGSVIRLEAASTFPIFYSVHW